MAGEREEKTTSPNEFLIENKTTICEKRPVCCFSLFLGISPGLIHHVCLVAFVWLLDFCEAGYNAAVILI